MYGIQQQYEFVHCGLSEFVACGETEVAAANFRVATKNLKKMTEHGMTGFQKQLQVSFPICLSVAGCQWGRFVFFR